MEKKRLKDVTHDEYDYPDDEGMTHFAIVAGLSLIGFLILVVVSITYCIVKIFS